MLLDRYTNLNFVNSQNLFLSPGPSEQPMDFEMSSFQDVNIDETSYESQIMHFPLLLQLL